MAKGSTLHYKGARSLKILSKSSSSRMKGLSRLLSGTAPLWGVTQETKAEDALKNMNEVVQTIVEEGVELPAASGGDVEVFERTRVAVTV